MRTYHRWMSVFVAAFALWYSVTGLALQTMDLSAILSGAPASDPTMMGQRVGENGPPNFQVLRGSDYTADALPHDFNFSGALAITTRSARATLGEGPISFLDLRMNDGRAVGEVLSGGKVHRFDAMSGAQIGDATAFKLPPLSLPSTRNTLKDVHRLRYFGVPFYWLDILFCLALLAMIYTGLSVYLPLWRSRAKTGRKALFWKMGGTWRMLHRGLAICATLFLVVVAVSGIVCSLSSLGVANSAAARGGKRPGLSADVSVPMSDGQLASMLVATRQALMRDQGDIAIRAIRLRSFGGMPQGVVITGGDARQLVYNAATGNRASMTDLGYPDNDMPFGWEAGQVSKKIHRGDYVGLGGRGMSIFAGLSLLYLAISGSVMYFELWKRRRKAGRKQFFWT